MKVTWIIFKAFVMLNDIDSKDKIYPVRLAFCSTVIEDTFKIYKLCNVIPYFLTLDVTSLKANAVIFVDIILFWLISISSVIFMRKSCPDISVPVPKSPPIMLVTFADTFTTAWIKKKKKMIFCLYYFA